MEASLRERDSIYIITSYNVAMAFALAADSCRQILSLNWHSPLIRFWLSCYLKRSAFHRI